MKPPRGIDKLGEHNYIHDSIVIRQRDPLNPGTCEIGDCNEIHENVKILVGPEGFKMGDYNVLHNGMFITGNVTMGHNCWFGQDTHLDGTGKLTLGNGVRIGKDGNVWSHVASGALLDGCTLFAMQETVLEDDVWLVGDNVHVTPGVKVARRSIALSHSVVTKDTEPECTYAGVPAKKLDIKFWKPLTTQEKFKMLYDWFAEYVAGSSEVVLRELNNALQLSFGRDTLLFGVNRPQHELDRNTTFFDIGNMTYTKRLTALEISVFRFLYGHKARFIPVEN